MKNHAKMIHLNLHYLKIIILLISTSFFMALNGIYAQVDFSAKLQKPLREIVKSYLLHNKMTKEVESIIQQENIQKNGNAIGVVVHLKDGANPKEVKKYTVKQYSVRNKVSCLITIDKIVELAKQDFVEWIREPILLHENDIENNGESYTTPAASSLGALIAHKEGYKGQNLKIALIDDQWDGATKDADFDGVHLPPLNQVKRIDPQLGGTFGGNGGAHGTACLEILYDILPEAQFYLIDDDELFHVSIMSLESSLDYILNNLSDIDIISCSQSSPPINGNPIDGSESDIDEQIDALTQNGTLVFFAMGNEALKHIIFSNKLKNIQLSDDGYFNFGANYYIDITTPHPNDFHIDWNDYYNNYNLDFDLEIYKIVNEEEIFLGKSSRIWFSNKPVEKYSINDELDRIRIKLKHISGKIPDDFYIEVHSSKVDIDGNWTYNAYNSIGFPAICQNSIAVGAININNKIEDYSSCGSNIRNYLKPEFVSFSGIKSWTQTNYSKDDEFFHGTSAATPYLAALAGLFIQKENILKNSQRRENLINIMRQNLIKIPLSKNMANLDELNFLLGNFSDANYQSGYGMPVYGLNSNNDNFEPDNEISYSTTIATFNNAKQTREFYCDWPDNCRQMHIINSKNDIDWYKIDHEGYFDNKYLMVSTRNKNVKILAEVYYKNNDDLIKLYDNYSFKLDSLNFSPQYISYKEINNGNKYYPFVLPLPSAMSQFTNDIFVKISSPYNLNGNIVYQIGLAKNSKSSTSIANLDLKMNKENTKLEIKYIEPNDADITDGILLTKLININTSEEQLFPNKLLDDVDGVGHAVIKGMTVDISEPGNYSATAYAFSGLSKNYSFSINNNVILYDGNVNSTSGHTGENFSFNITYKSSANKPPTDHSVKVVIDGTEWELFAQGNDFVNGVVYSQTIGPFSAGNHEFYFKANYDGKELRYPIDGILNFSVSENVAGWDAEVTKVNSSDEYITSSKNITISTHIHNNSDNPSKVYKNLAYSVVINKPDGSILEKQTGHIDELKQGETKIVDNRFYFSSNIPNGAYRISSSIQPILDENADNNVASKIIIKGNKGDELEYYCASNNSWIQFDRNESYNFNGSTYTYLGYDKNANTVFIKRGSKYYEIKNHGFRYFDNQNVIVVCETGSSWGSFLSFGMRTSNYVSFDKTNFVAFPGEYVEFTGTCTIENFSATDPDFYSAEFAENWYRDLDRFNGNTSAKFTFQIPANTSPGNYEFFMGARLNMNAHFIRKFSIKVLAPIPELTGISSNLISADDVIKVYGKNFDNSVKVKFNDLSGEIIRVSSTEITCVVPEGVSNGTLTVNSNGGTSNPIQYTVLSSDGVPMLINKIPDQEIIVGDTLFIVDLNKVFKDPNNKELKFELSYSNSQLSELTSKLKSGLLYIVAHAGKFNKCLLVVKAIDVTNKFTTDTVSIKINQPPLPPQLIYPSDGKINLEKNITFRWQQSEGASSYYLVISRDSMFQNIWKDFIIKDTVINVDGLSPGTKYFWYVYGINDFGIGNRSTVFWFKVIDLPPVVSLVSPETDSLGVINPITFVWKNNDSALYYNLQISTNFDFSFYSIDTLIYDTTVTLNSFSYGTKYFWRVAALNGGGRGLWSEVRNFKTLGEPTTVNILSPSADAINQPIELDLIWSKAVDQLGIITGKSKNKIRVKSEKGIVDPIKLVSNYWLEVTLNTDSNAVKSDTTIVDTTYHLSNLKNDTDYWWRVRAKNETGWGSFTEWSKFTTIVDTPEVVRLSMPSDSSKGNVLPVTLGWHTSSLAESYNLQLSSTKDFTTTLIDTSGLTDTTFTLSSLENLTEYYWRVKAVNIGGESEWSEVWTFKTLGEPTNVNLLSPSADAVNQPIELDLIWSKAVDQLGIITGKSKNKIRVKSEKGIVDPIKLVSNYWLEVTLNTDSNAVKSDTTIVDTTYHLSNLKNDTDYWWRVRAKNETGWGSFTEWSKFTTIVDTPEVVRLAIPSDSSKGNVLPVTLGWHTSSLAESYTLQLASTKDFTTTLIDTIGLTDTTFILSNLVNLTEYYWRVKAVNIGGESEWSEVWTFKTLGEPTTVNLLYPENGSINQPVDLELVWSKAYDQKLIAVIPNKIVKKLKNRNHIQTVTNYWLELTEDTLSEPVISENELADTTYNITGLKHNTTYYWRISAMNEAGWGEFTHWNNFTTIVPVPQVPQVLYPLADDMIVDTVKELTFIWKSVEYAEDYSINLSYNEMFDTLIVDTTGIADTIFTFYSDSKIKPFYWKVRATNVAGESSWSDSIFINVVLTKVDEGLNGTPKSYTVSQNYPNPFNPSTIIRFGIPEQAQVKLSLYNMLGQKITELVNEEKNAGYYEVNFNASNLSSGVYLYKLEATSLQKHFVQVKKMILMK